MHRSFDKLRDENVGLCVTHDFTFIHSSFSWKMEAAYSAKMPGEAAIVFSSHSVPIWNGGRRETDCHCAVHYIIAITSQRSHKPHHRAFNIRLRLAYTTSAVGKCS